MSTGTNQHLRVFVSDQTAGTDAADTASLTTGQFGFVAKDGSVKATPAAAAATGFLQVVINNGGIIQKGQPWSERDLADAIIKEAAPVPPVPISVKVQVPAAVIEGEEYVVRCTVFNYGGVISNQDEVQFYGNYSAKTGDDNIGIANKLSESLQKALLKAPNPPGNAVSDGAGGVIVTGLFQPYVKDKFDGHLPQIHLSLAHPEEAITDGEVTVVGTEGANTGFQVAKQEEFFGGYTEMYENRHREYPASKEPNFYADTSVVTAVGDPGQPEVKFIQAPKTGYESFTIEGIKSRRSTNTVGQKQTEVIYYNPEDIAYPAVPTPPPVE